MRMLAAALNDKLRLMTQCSLHDWLTLLLSHCLPDCSLSQCIAVSQLDIDGGGMQLSGNKVERSNCKIDSNTDF